MKPIYKNIIWIITITMLISVIIVLMVAVYKVKKFYRIAYIKPEPFMIVSKYPIWRTENDETDSFTTIFIKTSKYSNCEFKTCEKVVIPDTIYFCIKISK